MEKNHIFSLSKPFDAFASETGVFVGSSARLGLSLPHGIVACVGALAQGLLGARKERKQHGTSMAMDFNPHFQSLRIRLYVLRKGLGSLHSYSKDGIGTLIPILGRGLDS